MFEDSFRQVDLLSQKALPEIFRKLRLKFLPTLVGGWRII
ncbi:Uncharacterised protein [Photobacterium damselae]|uniref:Uncharacterized protein n=1 Tax=Photobacterium damselae TaxID=38293 RepID=A0A2X1WBG2_PHODM|nr:Uncharacterised protein [Photobacterium damselae]